MLLSEEEPMLKDEGYTTTKLCVTNDSVCGDIICGVI